MANAIQIKRRRSNGDPGAPNASGLKWGELAFNEADNTLYYGYGSGTDQALSVPSIGGSGSYSLRGGTNASGTWPISITGNAATVTNGVTYTGSSIEGYIPQWDNSSHVLSQGYQISTNLSTNNSSSFIPRADAVKTYVDSVKQGLDIKDSVRFASTQSDDYDTEFGVGQFENVLTSNNVGVFSIDGRTPVVGDRILLKNQFVSQGPHQNGIYNVLDLGGPASFFKLERSTDANNNDKVNAGMFVFVTEGATNADTGWVAISDDPILLNENNLNFSQFSAAGQIYDGSGLYKQGNTIGVGQGDGITVGENAVAVNAGSGLTVDANGVHIGVNGGLTLGDNSISVDSTVVRTTGNQTVSGIKTFDNGDTTSINIQTTVNGTGIIFFIDGVSPRMLLSYDGTGNELSIQEHITDVNKFKITTLTSLRASGTAENSTHIPLFISDPTTNSQVLCHKSKSDFISDLGIASTNVTLTAGSGLSGGGDLTSNQTFNVNTGYGLDISSDNVVVDTTEVVVTTGNQNISGVKNFFNFCGFHSGIALYDHGFAIENIVDDIGATFVIDRNGIITDGKWDAQTIDVNKGGTGQISYIDGELLIGNTTGNTLTKSTLTQGTAISITNGNGSITVAHGNTSNLTGTQASVGVANITVDEFGHVTSVTEATYVTSADLCTSISSCPIDGGTF